MAALTQLIEPEVNALGFDLVRVKLFGMATAISANKAELLAIANFASRARR
jgi:ribosome maturation factor RimP